MHTIDSYPAGSGRRWRVWSDSKFVVECDTEDTAQRIAHALNGLPQALRILRSIERRHRREINTPGRKSWELIARQMAGSASVAIGELDQEETSDPHRD